MLARLDEQKVSTILNALSVARERYEQNANELRRPDHAEDGTPLAVPPLRISLADQFDRQAADCLEVSALIADGDQLLILAD